MDRDQLIYKDLSYKICGLAFKIDNAIGYGHPEKTYGDAFEEMLTKESLEYQREVYFPLKINNKLIAKKFFDFLVEDKVLVELKVSDYKYRDVCRQVFDYLKSANLLLGLIVRFTRDGVKIKRIPNIHD